MPMSYDQLKERYKAQMIYYVNTYRFTYTATCIQCGLNTLLNLPSKYTFLIDWLIDYLRFYVPLKNFSLTIAGEGLQIYEGLQI
jgi:hypothetical protein